VVIEIQEATHLLCWPVFRCQVGAQCSARDKIELAERRTALTNTEQSLLARTGSNSLDLGIRSMSINIILDREDHWPMKGEISCQYAWWRPGENLMRPWSSETEKHQMNQSSGQPRASIVPPGSNCPISEGLLERPGANGRPKARHQPQGGAGEPKRLQTLTPSRKS